LKINCNIELYIFGVSPLILFFSHIDLNADFCLLKQKLCSSPKLLWKKSSLLMMLQHCGQK